jgi:hypothetical protein
MLEFVSGLSLGLCAQNIDIVFSLVMIKRSGRGGGERERERENFDHQLAICRVVDHVGDNSRINTIQWSNVSVGAI